jgi:hypothetical protein
MLSGADGAERTRILSGADGAGRTATVTGSPRG